MLRIIALFSWVEAVLGVAYPAPAVTPRAQHVEKRQQQVLSTVWGPTLVGTSLSYRLYNCNAGSTLAASGNNWNCCPTTGTCYIPTACSSGTIFVAGTSIACSSLYSDTATNRCGIDKLFSTTGASQSLDKIVCAGTSLSPTQFYFVVSPTIDPTTTTTPSPGPTTTTATPSKKTPVGAIVGGVVGGLAVLALVILGVFLILKRKRKNRAAAAPAPVGHQPQIQEYHPQSGGMAAGAGAVAGAHHDPRHASVYSAPGSPPPVYYNNGQQQQYYDPNKYGAQLSPGASPYPVDNKNVPGAPSSSGHSPGGFSSMGHSPGGFSSQYSPSAGPASAAPGNHTYEMASSSPTHQQNYGSGHQGAFELPADRR